MLMLTRASQLFLPTYKETPSDAALKSHQLMLRAGLIQQHSKGIYMVTHGLTLFTKSAKSLETLACDQRF